MTRPYSMQDGLKVTRWVDTADETLRDFIDKMGQALQGKGTTYSLGSMAVSLLTERQFKRSIQGMHRRNKEHIDLTELEAAIQEKFREKRPKDVNLDVEGIGLYGERDRRGNVSSQAKIAFVIDPANHVVRGDVEAVSDVFEDFSIPALSPLENPHMTFGIIYLSKIFGAEGENPNLLVPKRAIIPHEAAMHGLKAEIIRAEPPGH